MPFFYILFFVTTSFASERQMESRYEYTLTGYIPRTKELDRIENVGNRIHCASACLKSPGCKGFGYDAIRTCMLLDTYMDEDYCRDDNCIIVDGMKVYMEKATTAATEEPTTTTRKPTTTLAPTTKITEAPTEMTTVEPTSTTEGTTEGPQVFIVACEKETDILYGFAAKAKFFNSKFDDIYCYSLEEEWIETSAKEENVVANGNDNGLCPYGYIATQIKYFVLNSVLITFELKCNKVKENFFDKTDVVHKNTEGGEELDCEESYGLYSLKHVSKSEGDVIYFDIVAVCHHVQKLLATAI